MIEPAYLIYISYKYLYFFWKFFLMPISKGNSAFKQVLDNLIVGAFPIDKFILTD